MTDNKCNKLNVLVNIHSTCWQNSILTMLWLSRTTYKIICPYVVDKNVDKNVEKDTQIPTICKENVEIKDKVDKKTYLPKKYTNKQLLQV